MFCHAWKLEWNAFKNGLIKHDELDKVECRQSITPRTCQTLFHLAKAKDLSGEITKKVFDQLNIGPSLSEWEREKL